MLNKNLIYTAWTRAKEEIHMVGQPYVLNKCGKIKNIDLRKTILSQRMEKRDAAYNKKYKNKKPKIS